MQRPWVIWLNVALDGLLIGYSIAASVQTSVAQLPDAAFVSKYITPLIVLGLLDALILYVLSGSHHTRPKGLFAYYLLTRVVVLYEVYRLLVHRPIRTAVTIELALVLLIGLTLFTINKFSFASITK